jgi:hypothetical protein
MFLSSRPALRSLTIGKVRFKNPAGFLKAGRRRLICILSRKFSERLLRFSKRLSGKAEEQKDIETGGKKYQSPSETVFDIWQSRFLPEVSLNGFLRGSGFRRPQYLLAFVSRVKPWSVHRVMMALSMTYHQPRRCFCLEPFPTFDLPKKQRRQLRQYPCGV